MSNRWPSSSGSAARFASRPSIAPRCSPASRLGDRLGRRDRRVERHARSKVRLDGALAGEGVLRFGVQWSGRFARESHLVLRRGGTLRVDGDFSVYSGATVTIGEGANCGSNYAASGPLGNQYPLLSAGVNAYGGGGSLTLEIGETAFPRLAAEKEAAVQRLVPRTDRAAF